MELRSLRTFVAVARCRSFSQAAEELGYTQSAVSQHVAALEADLGVRLLERRPVGPTAAGERLLEHAARILLHADAARVDLARGEVTGRVALAVTPHVEPRLVATGLRALVADHPMTAVAIVACTVDEAAAAVASGLADVALLAGAVAPTDPLVAADPLLFASRVLREAGLVVALPAGHPLGGRATLDLESLADAPWIDAPALDPGTAAVLRGITDARRRSSTRYDGSDVRTLLALVAAGHGLALLAAEAADAPGVVGVPVHRPRVVHRTELLAPRAPRPAAAAAIAALVAAAA